MDAITLMEQFQKRRDLRASTPRYTYFCRECERPYDEPDYYTYSEPQREGPPYVYSTAHCPYCGADTEEEADICDNCGEAFYPIDGHLCCPECRELASQIWGTLSDELKDYIMEELF